MPPSLVSSVSLQLSGETGAIIALVIALGIAGVAIVWLAAKKQR